MDKLGDDGVNVMIRKKHGTTILIVSIFVKMKFLINVGNNSGVTVIMNS